MPMLEPIEYFTSSISNGGLLSLTKQPVSPTTIGLGMREVRIMQSVLA